MSYMSAQQFVVIVMAGLVATTGMSLFALSFKQLGIIPVNTVRAIGSTVTGTMNSALPVGWMIHYSVGLVFAFVYTAVLRFIGATSFWGLVTSGGFIGALHGVLIGFILVISVGEYHHIKRYRDEGMGLAGVYFLAHMVYGVLIGCMLALGHVGVRAI
jgi:hypothetical protein